jgi:predicted phosphodiesterase
MSKISSPIVIAGDVHANLQWTRMLVRSANAVGARTILQLGDMGALWPGRGKGRTETKLDRYLGALGLELIFIDGNHDNHHDLRALEVEADGLAHVRERIKYLPRAGRITLHGMRIAGLGGAFSPDYKSRRPGLDWWPAIEEVEASDVEKLIADGPMDILLTHDVPAAVPIVGTFELSEETRARAQVSRDLLQRAVDATRPRNIFCGHWHQRASAEIHHEDGFLSRVDVLDMDGSPGNAVIVWPGSPLRIEPLIVHG